MMSLRKCLIVSIISIVSKFNAAIRQRGRRCNQRPQGSRRTGFKPFYIIVLNVEQMKGYAVGENSCESSCPRILQKVVPQGERFEFGQKRKTCRERRHIAIGEPRASQM